MDWLCSYSWHVDCVRKMSLNAFICHYQSGCKRKKYSFSPSKAEEIMEKQRSLFPYFLRMTLQSLWSVRLLTSLIMPLQPLSHSHNYERNCFQAPESPVVMAMKGIGISLGPQLTAEIGDVSCFTHKDAITAFAGVNESGSYEQKSVSTQTADHLILEKLYFRWWMS